MKYRGHKDIPGVREKLVNNTPEHLKIVELFAGSCAHSKALFDAGAQGIMYGNDLNWRARHFWEDYPITEWNCDALELLDDLRREGKGTFIFVDPPYMHETRPTSTKIYGENELTDQDHAKLLYKLQGLRCHVMIIHPVCKLYDTYLSNWKYFDVSIRYNRKTSRERVYMNYDISELKLQTYKLLGEDCHDRQRINRKIGRLTNKLLALPKHEREAIIQRVLFKE